MSGNSNYLYQAASASAFGNEGLQSELKKEFEFGVEAKVLHNKLGLNLSYYNNQVNHQIIPAFNIAPSSGATTMIVNGGSLSNWGIEAAIDATPVAVGNWQWNTRFNWAIDRNKLTSLPSTLGNTLTVSSQDGGYAVIRADVGEALGDIWVHPIATDSKGNKIITSSGIYSINTDPNHYVKVGNILPSMIGGWSNTISYKAFSLDFTIDYRFGGDLLSIPTYYQIGAGMYKNTLQYRDAAHGGLPYNIVNGQTVAAPAGQGTFNDGVILKGMVLNTDGSESPNTQIIDASHYYQYTYNWESTGDYSRAVFKNSYIKFREAALSYHLPDALVHKLHFQRLSVSLFGRNLFYIWKTLPHGLDPEVGVGSAWYSQGIDGGNPAPTRSLGLSLNASF
jgi:iron complex outermembrane receptor protein